jgi:aspartate 1-decarboxylase
LRPIKINFFEWILALIFPGLAALKGLAAGAAAVTNAVVIAKHHSAEEEEMKRHNPEMDKIAR